MGGGVQHSEGESERVESAVSTEVVRLVSPAESESEMVRPVVSTWDEMTLAEVEGGGSPQASQGPLH